MKFFRKRGGTGPDYSSVNSRKEAGRRVAKGELVAMLLLPEEFGGDARTENTVYVPPFVAELKSDADKNIILPLAAEGKITRYRAEPEYTGRSLVPITIKLVAFDPRSWAFLPPVRLWSRCV